MSLEALIDRLDNLEAENKSLKSQLRKQQEEISTLREQQEIKTKIEAPAALQTFLQDHNKRLRFCEAGVRVLQRSGVIKRVDSNHTNQVSIDVREALKKQQEGSEAVEAADFLQYYNDYELLFGKQLELNLRTITEHMSDAVRLAIRRGSIEDVLSMRKQVEDIFSVDLSGFIHHACFDSISSDHTNIGYFATATVAYLDYMKENKLDGSSSSQELSEVQENELFAHIKKSADEFADRLPRQLRNRRVLVDLETYSKLSTLVRIVLNRFGVGSRVTTRKFRDVCRVLAAITNRGESLEVSLEVEEDKNHPAKNIFTSEHFAILTQYLSGAEKIAFNGDTPDISGGDVVENLPKLKNLETVYFRNNRFATGEWIDALTSTSCKETVTHVQIEKCGKITSEMAEKLREMDHLSHYYLDDKRFEVGNHLKNKKASNNTRYRDGPRDPAPRPKLSAGDFDDETGPRPLFF